MLHELAITTNGHTIGSVDICSTTPTYSGLSTVSRDLGKPLGPADKPRGIGEKLTCQQPLVNDEHLKIQEFSATDFHIEIALWAHQWDQVLCWLKLSCSTQRNERLTPLLFKALDENRLDIITFLLEHDRFSNQCMFSLLFKALHKKPLAIASFLLERCTVRMDEYPAFRVVLNRPLVEKERYLIVILITFSTLDFSVKETLDISLVKSVDICFVLLLTLERLIYHDLRSLGRQVMQIATDILVDGGTLAAMRYLYRLVDDAKPSVITKQLLLDLQVNMLEYRIKSPFLTELVYFTALTGALLTLPENVINTYLVPILNPICTEKNRFDFFGKMMMIILKKSLTKKSPAPCAIENTAVLTSIREVILQQINMHTMATEKSSTNARRVAFEALRLAITYAPECETRSQLFVIIAHWKKSPSLIDEKNNEMVLHDADISDFFFSRLPLSRDRRFINELSNRVFSTPLLSILPARSIK